MGGAPNRGTVSSAPGKESLLTVQSTKSSVPTDAEHSSAPITSATSTTIADADRVVTNDAGTMKQVALSDVKTYLTSAGFVTDDPTALAIALG